MVMKCKNRYADEEKYRNYRNAYKKRYYMRTGNAPNKGARWTDAEIALIQDRRKSDTELAALMGRSVESIQIKRSRMAKKMF